MCTQHRAASLSSRRELWMVFLSMLGLLTDHIFVLRLSKCGNAVFYFYFLSILSTVCIVKCFGYFALYERSIMLNFRCIVFIH